MFLSLFWYFFVTFIVATFESRFYIIRQFLDYLLNAPFRSVTGYKTEDLAFSFTGNTLCQTLGSLIMYIKNNRGLRIEP